MTAPEKYLKNTINSNNHFLFFAIITLIGLVVRLYGLNYVSVDMYCCLIPWFDEIKARGGLASLSIQIGNYSLLYQTIIALMTYINLPCIIMYKGFSIFFDFMLAYAAAALVCEGCGKKPQISLLFNCVYAVTLFLPTVTANSAYWGQCDSIYTFFLVLTLKNMYKEKYIPAFIYYGIAFSFKFQSVFMLPFIICLYFKREKMSILHLLISAAVFFLSGIVTYIKGSSPMALIWIYGGQTAAFPDMSYNIASFWVMFNNIGTFRPIAIFTALSLCGLGLYLSLNNIKKHDTPESFYNTAAWFLWTLLLFLPSMHERYTYPLDILLVCLCFFDKKYIKYAAVSIILSTITYGTGIILTEEKLCVSSVITSFHGFIYTAAWLYYTYETIKGDRTAKHPQQ